MQTLRHQGPTTAAATAGTFLFLVLFALAIACAPSRESIGAESGEKHADANHEEGENPHDEGVVELTPAKLEAVEIEYALVEYRPLRPQLETTGQVDYEQSLRAHVSPRIPGRVINVQANLGDEVSRGNTLVTIDSVELGEAKAQYLAARSRESVTRETYEREQKLYEDRITSQREVLDAKAEFLEAEAIRQSARETLRLFGLSGGQIDGLEAGDLRASSLPVRAPISGRIVERHVTIGELVSPSDNLFTIADLSNVWIWIDVFERDLAKVHEGDEVEVRVDAYPDRVFAGEVSYLSPDVATETRTVRARIDAANPARLLRPGMFASVRLSDPHTDGTESLVVPSAAVVRAEGREIAFVPLGNGRFDARPVEVGRREGEWVEILSGLEAGMEVVSEGAFVLKSELARDELGGEHGH